MKVALGLIVVAALAVTASARPGGGQTFHSSSSSHSYTPSHSYSSSSSSHSYTPSYSSSHSYTPSSSSSSSHSYDYDHSYSGGGTTSHSWDSSTPSSSSSSSEWSPAMIIICLLGLGIFILTAFRWMRDDGFYTSPLSMPAGLARLDLSPVLDVDPDFSRVGFEDFVYQLYSAAQRARHDATALAKLTPYFAPNPLFVLEHRGGKVDQVVIGTLRISRVQARPPDIAIAVDIEANLASARGTVNAVERWTFVRAMTTKTRPPDQARALACPNCGAPFISATDPRTCSHCNQQISIGRFDWTVSEISVGSETSVGYTLTGTVEEVGNDFPTVADATVQLDHMKLRDADPNVTFAALRDRLAMIYDRLNAAWKAQDLTPVRGLVTASLLQYLQFWINEYKRQGLVNQLADANIDHVALAKVTRDKWFDAITVRVYASGRDFTTDASGNVVGGSQTDRRDYTEYWTFIRAANRKGPVTTEPKCPNCGAPLAISDAGACTHCNAMIESGDFDWTLSKIEQDDVYRG